MSDFQPLNPTLYKLLQLHFGEVGVVAQGQEFDGYLAREIGESRTGERKTYLKRKVRNSGEEYKVNCRFCGDQRQRLYINHRWGVFDVDTGDVNLFLCQCWNEQCMDNWDRQKQLHDWVMSSAAARRGDMAVRQGTKVAQSVSEVAPPGVLIRLDELKKRHPYHEAIAYLQARGFDTDFLAERYDISFCPHSKWGLAQNRIIIPLYRDGKLVSWQARFVGDSVGGVPFNKAKVPKFWTCPNSARRLLAYNLETAVRHTVVVVVEGSTDVWQAGPHAMGLWGKTMNPALMRRFISLLRRYHPDQFPVVCVALDPEQDEKEKAKGKPHHIDSLVAQLQPALGNRVFGLFMPEGCDPGGLERTVFRNMIRAGAAKHGLKVQFTRPRELA